MGERVILVDAADVEIGTGEKLHTHRAGLLHRAFSVFLFHSEGLLLLQRRASEKYHSGGLWSNTCCGHPRPEESVHDAAHRRLREEMELECTLRPAFSFTYRIELPNGLIEHEFDHVFVGACDDTPTPNPREVQDWCWCSPEELESTIHQHPGRFSAWLPIAWCHLLTSTPNLPAHIKPYHKLRSVMASAVTTPVIRGENSGVR